MGSGLRTTGRNSRGLQAFLSVLGGIVLGLLVLIFLVGIPKVAVINIPYAELSGETAQQIVDVLQYVRDDRSIKAVVVNLNSPGGGVSESSEIFINMVKLREKKPVVVAVTDFAASGAYFMLLGANYVYTNPAAFVGNVGVILWLPYQGGPSERIITSGPFKGTGGSERMYLNLLEEMKETFVSVVMSQRGDRLRISAEEVSEGRIYTGIQAVRLGLVDELGVEDDAIKKAASLARLRNYRVIDVNKELEKKGIKLSFSKKEKFSMESFKPEFPYIYYRFVEPR
jgi:protease-4